MNEVPLSISDQKNIKKIDEFFSDTTLGKREEAKIKREDDKSRNDALRQISRMVAKSTPAMVAAAIGAAIGSFVILKAETNDRGQMKWVPIPEHKTEDIINAVTIIAEAMAEGRSWNEFGFVMIQQKDPDVRALNTMLDRGFGKVAESVQINKNVTFSLADVGRKALASKRREVGHVIEQEERQMMQGEVVVDIACDEPSTSTVRRLMPTSW